MGGRGFEFRLEIENGRWVFPFVDCFQVINKISVKVGMAVKNESSLLPTVRPGMGQASGQNCSKLESKLN